MNEDRKKNDGPGAVSAWSLLLSLLIAFALISCSTERAQTLPADRPAGPPRKIANEFAYPVGGSDIVTQAKDSKDDWFNAQDFGKNNHLGEDWNKNSGGNTDCGEPVYAIANGVITYAADAGPGWGNVLIVTHTLPDGKEVQSLYGHLKEMLKTEGEVRLREKIGTIGNANGRYLCHLHFEIREDHCPSWDLVFVGYSPIRYGWVDPSDFIDNRRKHDRQGVCPVLALGSHRIEERFQFPQIQLPIRPDTRT